MSTTPMERRAPRVLIALYGPPAAGKSTLVRCARLTGYGGLDLENYGPGGRLDRIEGARHACRSWASSPTQHSPGHVLVLGTADLSRADVADAAVQGNLDALHVLLLPHRDAYDARRIARDAAQPEKAGQGDYYDGFARNSATFDVVIDSTNEGGSAFKTLARVFEACRVCVSSLPSSTFRHPLLPMIFSLPIGQDGSRERPGV